MSITKVCGTVAALMLLGSYSASASAGHCEDLRAELTENAMDIAVVLRCTDYPSNSLGFEGKWDPLNPIWQYRPKQGGDGCEVHYKLSKKLDDLSQKEEDEDSNKRKGPLKKNRGVARALEDHRDQTAFDLLQSFIDTILYGARLNPANDLAYAQAFDFVMQASDLQRAVGDLMVCK